MSETIEQSTKDWREQLRDYRDENGIEKGEWGKFLKQYYQVDSEIELVKDTNKEKFSRPNEDQEFADHLEADFEFWRSGGMNQEEAGSDISQKIKRKETADDAIRRSRKEKPSRGQVDLISAPAFETKQMDHVAENRVSEKVEVEFSKTAQEKNREDQNIFDLKLNPKVLEKYTSKEERRGIELFLEQLKHNDIGWFGFDVNKGDEIVSVTCVTKQGERMKISAILFRRVFDNVLPEGKGLGFVVPGVKKADILPGMNPQEVKEVMGDVKIDGKMLPDDTIYFIG